ncbi:MAG TPA: DHA2 family efflux MFS transporter permease subunit [Candidatus Acidoferrales bacterium]|nr:DHA2 family efflux MFS transporter permease subunit [Candidatus Acidoferrales bacterium]
MAETGARKWIITITVILSSVIELIDTTIVNVSLPQMMGNLGATLDEIAWVVTAYIFANVIVVPMASWLAAFFGRRNYFAASIILFTTASFFCGHATNIWELVFFRFLQGAGGGALMSTSQSILVETFPPEELGFATGLFGLGVVVGPTIGPTLGGWITDNYSWPWVFYVNIPIGIVATLLTITFIHDPKEKRETGSVDWWGIFLLIAGIGSLQIVLDRGERDDWFSAPYITALSLVACIGIVAFIWRELTAEHPVVDLRVLKNRSLAVGTLFTFIYGFGMYASVFIFPVFVQSLLGFTALQTGLILLPSSVTAAVLMPFVGRLIRRGFPPQLLIVAGFMAFCAFTWQLSNSTLASGQAEFFWPLILRGVGLSLLFVPFTTLALATLRGKDIHQGTGLTGMMRQLGGSFGVAIVATFVEHRSWAHRQDLLRYVTPFDFPLQQRLDAIVHGLVSHGSTVVEAQRQAYAAIDGIVTKQAYLLTYMDAFRTIGIFFLCCIPLLVLFKRGVVPANVRLEME